MHSMNNIDSVRTGMQMMEQACMVPRIRYSSTSAITLQANTCHGSQWSDTEQQISSTTMHGACTATDRH